MKRVSMIVIFLLIASSFPSFADHTSTHKEEEGEFSKSFKQEMGEWAALLAVAAGAYLVDEAVKAYNSAKTVRITGIEPGYQATSLGLQSGDILYQYDREIINSTDELIYQVKSNSHKSAVGGFYIRNNEIHPITFKGGKIGIRIEDSAIDQREINKMIDSFQSK